MENTYWIDKIYSHLKKIGMTSEEFILQPKINKREVRLATELDKYSVKLLSKTELINFTEHHPRESKIIDRFISIDQMVAKGEIPNNRDSWENKIKSSGQYLSLNLERQIMPIKKEGYRAINGFCLDYIAKGNSIEVTMHNVFGKDFIVASVPQIINRTKNKTSELINGIKTTNLQENFGCTYEEAEAEINLRLPQEHLESILTVITRIWEKIRVSRSSEIN